ncbi:MAG: hypothetical protein A2566_02235 [Candidatus Zambryskibacteria bacterium RIFOXYD1_FULL_40_13]|nr:MAG: Short chain dehydrogenase [Parcubacteria group bacterium GW2011_GWC1_39_12]KKR19032.1 MAG: Short chain dehydrogenase [Parcubacteria group bacterium GW2011_GWF1_39_37]KKR35599.1 MAG: Short chain dehydrogenase [Parcubacteria group bacterium GW2011_GWC2_40_10]KKR52010.1 MAG: Short chain dehydrogenase [Parcubacteria group bacterium GW2011_GWE1_40_20]KKR66016.1 MAG: Short chain dehydrogenase [Parcubacteria group bacterium GW2011_GWB1_40_5]KKR68798.1 MAG: Short chain dehydrogenase [Parcubact
MPKKYLTILITGASSGIGKSLVKKCIGNGNKVIGIARRRNELEKLKIELSSDRFEYYNADVADQNAIKKIRDDLEIENNIPDVIVCAAAMFEKDTHPYDAELIKKTIEVNFFGTMNIVENFLDIFVKNGHGHFITLSSITSWRANIKGISYPASKAAIAIAFRGLNLHYQKNNVHFSTIYLGPVETDMWEGRKSFMLTTPEKVAERIMVLINHPKSVSYIPFLSTTIARLLTLIPDELYAKLSSYLVK